jgi:hypothetical protein
LLQAQVEHMQEAELCLPLQYASKKYIRAITTEGEAADYIREVTEAIHRAHKNAARVRANRIARKEKRVTTAAEAKQPSLKRAVKAKAKKSVSKSKRKKK